MILSIDDSFKRDEVLIALEEANGNTQISNDQNTTKGGMSNGGKMQSTYIQTC